MTPIEYLDRIVLPMVMLLLPEKMDSVKARAMLLAIALQESRVIHRVQVGGPAHGFWQFEKGGGIRGVLNHAATKQHIQKVCQTLQYAANENACYEAVTHNDLLAAAFARLNLWWSPKALPDRGQAQAGWDLYISTWRPGKPHRETWDGFYKVAWDTVSPL